MSWHFVLRCAGAYLVVGLLVLPAAFLMSSLREVVVDDFDGAPAWKVALALAVLGGAVVVLWPLVLYGMWEERSGQWVWRFRSPLEPDLPAGIDPDELREWRARNPEMIRPVRIEQIDFGRYDVHCLHCSHDFSCSGLIHGFGENDFLTLGYVCSRCHRLAERTWNRENRRPERPLCECGGELLREGQVLCPNCGSPDVCCLYLPSAVT